MPVNFNTFFLIKESQEPSHIKQSEDETERI